MGSSPSLSAARRETQVQHPEYTYFSASVLYHEAQAIDGRLFSKKGEDEAAQLFDLTDRDATIMFAFSLRRCADQLLATIPLEVLAERYPESVRERDWQDIPLF